MTKTDKAEAPVWMIGTKKITPECFTEDLLQRAARMPGGMEIVRFFVEQASGERLYIPKETTVLLRAGALQDSKFEGE